MPSGYEGTVVRIPLGREGLTYSKNPSSLPPSGLLQAESVVYSDDSLHLMPGRTLLGGYGGVSFSFVPADVNTGADTVTKVAHGKLTGDGPVFITKVGAGTMPSGLTGPGTNYWLIKASVDTLKFATSRANALAGTAVDITSQGTATSYTVASRSIFSVYDWFPDEQTQYVVTVSSDGHVYIAASATETQLAQNETVPPGGASPTRVVFVECGGASAITVTAQKMLAIFTGTGQPGFFQGTQQLIPSKFSTIPTDWSVAVGGFPVNGVVHGNRLIAFGCPSKPHQLYGSTIDNHQDFRTGVETGNPSASSAIYVHVHPGVGLRLYQGFSHKGMLFLLKYPRGVFFLDDSDQDPRAWKSNIISDAMGCAPTPFAGIQVDDGILFMSASGQFFLITATSQGGVTVTDLSTRMLLDVWLASHVNLTRLSQVVASWDSFLKIAYFAVPSKIGGANSLTNDLLLYFDFRAFTRGEAKVRFGYSYRDATQAITNRRNPATYVQEVMSADYAGNLWRLGDDDRSINTALPGATAVLTGYTGRFQINHSNLEEYVSHGYYSGNDPKLAVMNKNYDWLGIEYVPNTGGSVTVTEYVDGVAQPQQTVSLSQTGPRFSPAPGFTEFTIYIGSGSTVASELAGATQAGLDLRVKWVKLVGTGRRVSIEVASSGVASEDAHITALYLGFREAGQDVGRGQGSA